MNNKSDTVDSPEALKQALPIRRLDPIKDSDTKAPTPFWSSIEDDL